MNGRFAVNTVDNLLVVHHQASKTSAVFDIRWAGDYDGAISLHHPVLAALPISPVTVPVPEGPGKCAPVLCCVALPLLASVCLSLHTLSLLATEFELQIGTFQAEF